MKNLFLLFFFLLLATTTEILATPLSLRVEGEQQISKRDRNEWKTYQQRLNKLNNNFQQAKTAEVRTLYQALVTDIRREIAQVKAAHVTSNYSISTRGNQQTATPPSARNLRLMRMESIQKELRKLSLSSESRMQTEDKQIFTLLREFGSLMKADLED